MQKPQDFDNVQAFGDFVPLPAGGYVCRIMGVEETAARESKAPMIKISLDIAEGQFKDYFANQYRANTRADKKWSYSAIINQLVYDTSGNNSTNRGFKTFVTSVCESNPGFNVAWGDGFAACFKNRLVGVLFGREEYIGTDGKTHWSTKALNFRSVKTIRDGNFEIPADKPLVSVDAAADPFAPPQTPQPAAQQKSAPAGVPDLQDFEEILVPESDLPF
ncbi:MAG: hypothetical protein II410_03630 [Ruminococcus sp.]|nr:hypothetical protein [Ruminococcus sp.]